MINTSIRDLAILSGLLIVVAYYAGSLKLANGIIAGINTLLLTVTGRKPSGDFAAYPTNAPTS